MSAYLALCEEYRAVPFSRIFEVLESGLERLDLSHFAIGDRNLVPLCKCLETHEDVRELLLGDNGLSRSACTSLASLVQATQSISCLDLSSNAIGHNIGLVVSAAKAYNRSLLHLNLSRIKLSRLDSCDAIGAFLACEDVPLQTLDLSFNDLNDRHAARIIMGLSTNRHLVVLNMSWNKCELQSARALRDVYRSWNVRGTRSGLEHVRMGWNNLGDGGAAAIAECLMWSSSLKKLELSNNSIHYSGALILSEALRLNVGLTTLILSKNPIGLLGSHVLLHRLRAHRTLHCLGLDSVESPLHTQVVHCDDVPFDHTKINGHYVFNLARPWDHAVFQILRRYHADGRGKCFRAALNRGPCRAFSSGALERWVPKDRIRHYVCDDDDEHETKGNVFKVNDAVEARWRDREEWVRGRIVAERGDSFDVMYRFGASKNKEGAVRHWVCPDVGTMELDFVRQSRLVRSSNATRSGRPRSRLSTIGMLSKVKAKSNMSYRLDLSKEDDRMMLRQVLRAARAQPGENLLNETYDGEPFDFDEDTSSHWIEDKREGIFECTFKSTKLVLQRRMSFDLESQNDVLIVRQILERVFQAKFGSDEVDSSGETWQNATLDGTPLDLSELRVNLDEYGEDTNDAPPQKESEAEQDARFSGWRLPSTGILSFDLYIRHPRQVAVETYRFDLNVTSDRERALKIVSGAMRATGAFLFNERVDEKSVEISSTEDVPSRGIFAFEHVVLAPPDGADRQLVVDDFRLDMSRSEDLRIAAALRQRAIVMRETKKDGSSTRHAEFWRSVYVDDRTRLPTQLLLCDSTTWTWPTRGTLTFQYCAESTRTKRTSDAYVDALVQSMCRSEMTSRDRLLLLEAFAMDTTSSTASTFLTIEHIARLLSVFCDSDDVMNNEETVWSMLYILIPRLESPHKVAKLLLRRVVMSDRCTSALFRFLETGALASGLPCGDDDK